MGYDSAMEIKKCIDDNINPIVPRSNNQQPQKDKGLFVRNKFTYDTEQDCYICPNNQQLTKSTTTQNKKGKISFLYRGSSPMCKACPLKDKCIPNKTPYKRLFRWEHEEVIEKHIKKMKTEEYKDIVKKRGSIVEHPFGTIKRTLGWDHFLVRGKNKVAGENALIMFTYNFKRMLNLIGITLFKKLIIAIKTGDMEQIIKDIEEYILLFNTYIAYFLQIIFMIQFYQQKMKINKNTDKIT